MGTVIKHCLPCKVLTYLGKFGAESAKPVIIWSSVPEVEKLKRKRPIDMQKLTVKDGERVTGINAKLRNSQANPTAFGEAMAQVCMLLHKACKVDKPTSSPSSSSTSTSPSSAQGDNLEDDTAFAQHHLIY